MKLLLLTCTITWTPQCAAGRATEGKLALPAPAIDHTPVPTKHTRSEQMIVGAAENVVREVRLSVNIVNRCIRMQVLVVRVVKLMIICIVDADC